jgi:hypothetical protein
MNRPSTAPAWTTTHEAVLRGLNHALSNRVAALVGLTRILEQNAGDRADPITAALLAEVERLEAVLRLYVLLPAGAASQDEAVELPSLLGAAVRLHELRSDLAEPRCEVQSDADTRPVRGCPTQIVHALLSVLGLAAHGGRADVAVRARCGSGERESYVRVTWDEAAVRSAEPLPKPAVREARAQVERAGGRLVEQQGGWEARFAAL